MKAIVIDSKRIYTPKERLEADVYAYIRGWRDNTVGFSVIDTATDNPDLSNCGVFWVKPEDFISFFKVYK